MYAIRSYYVMDGENKEVPVTVTTPAGKTATYTIYVHVQADNEILYLSSNSNGIVSTAKDYDKNVYNALTDAGYSVTFAKKGSIFEWTADGIVPFDYTLV